MIEKVKALYEVVTKAHRIAYSRLQNMKAAYIGCTDMRELADFAYAFREMSKFCADLAAEFKRAQELCEKLACLIWIKTSDGRNIKTPYCTATPRLKTTAAIPKKKHDPERYQALMEFLKVPKELWNGENEIVRVHWPSFIEYTTALEEQGERMPPGLDTDKTYTVYTLRIVKRKSVNEEKGD